MASPSCDGCADCNCPNAAAAQRDDGSGEPHTSRPDTNIVFPVYNLHGTPTAELAEGFLAVRSGLRELRDAVDCASPNGRDYYLIGDGALLKAQKERAAIFSAIDVLRDEMLALADEQSRAECAGQTAKLSGVPEVPSVLPIVHSNGTSRAHLVESASAAYRAALKVEGLLQAVIPNARDYAGRDEWNAAREQHAIRVLIVRRIGGFFLRLASAIKSAGLPAS